MKYMTKEWYLTAQRTSLHLMLEVSKKAESFSEDFFRELYKREEKKWLECGKELYEFRFEDIFPEEFCAEYADGAPLEESEFEEAKKAYLEQRERAREHFENKPEFNPEQERKNFKRSLLSSINNLKKTLPEDILRKVADIRVLALDVASREVKQEITKYCKQNEKRVNSAIEAYRKEYNKQFESNAPSFGSEISLHDCEVLSCRKKGNDVVLTVDNSGGFTNISQIRMKNCTVIKQDAPLHGACCLYEEIYKTGEQYEIHFLLQKTELIDYIVTTDGLEFN